MEQLEQFVTTKELAEVLGVGESTVKRAIEKLRPVLGGVATNNQGGFLFNSNQATQIKQEIQSHHNLASRQIDSVSTQLEENQTIYNALQILQRRNLELTQRADIAEKTNALLMHTSETYTFTQMAKELNKPSRGFGEWLHQEGYIYSQNGAWIPYFGKESLFEQKQITINDSFCKYNTHITQKGRCELLKKYGGVTNGR